MNEVMACTHCGANVRITRIEVSMRVKKMAYKCDCMKSGKDVHPYEVDGWEWVGE